MARPKDILPAASLEVAVTALFCFSDDAYRPLNPDGFDDYG